MPRAIIPRIRSPLPVQTKSIKRYVGMKKLFIIYLITKVLPPLLKMRRIRRTVECSFQALSNSTFEVLPFGLFQSIEKELWTEGTKVHKRKTRYYPKFVRKMAIRWYCFYIFSCRFLTHQRQRGYWNSSSSDWLRSHSTLQEKERTWLYVCKSIQEACPISLLQSRLKRDDQVDLKDSSITQFQG